MVEKHHEAADVGAMLTGRASFMFDTIKVGQRRLNR